MGNGTGLGIDDINLIEEDVETINSCVQDWEGFKSDLESTLNGDIGCIFSENFTIGKDASDKILKIFGVLLGMEERINSLIRSTYDFLDVQRDLNAGNNII